MMTHDSEVFRFGFFMGATIGGFVIGFLISLFDTIRGKP